MVCLKCPFCFFDESKVVDSRSTDDNTTIRRRRECTSCGRRYTTYEKIEDIPILVVKRDLTRENFNREKNCKWSYYSLSKETNLSKTG